MNGQQQHRRVPNIRNSSLWMNREEVDPMGTRFKIDDTDFLDEIPERNTCPNCHKSRRYYCYTCYVPLDVIKERLPRVKLPVKVDIIKHIQEVDGKSTCPHAAIISPEDCRIHTFPDIPHWDYQKTVLLFPGPNAQTLRQLLDNHYNHINDNRTSISSIGEIPFDTVVFIDSTWRQTKQVLNDSRVRPLLANGTVVLSDHESLFWRHQRNTPRTYLSTIEAMYYFFVDLHLIVDEHCGRVGPDGRPHYDYRYDNLLFFFKHTYNKLRQKYNI
ncbi:tRNA-uridine aminocarboxypropyltransferase 1-like [Oppia nitens]|uniref:tRNA-uridine aminocarboxypropyltransferase 1-like n=1 Tax=Oppia nitens TaxID=1686743 RepID=UPI0023DA1065|nr:tRNA-uridine aminocarboxypropyltransferase 1-like [Oppia nitens]